MKPVVRESLVDRLAGEIRSSINGGDYALGQRLPTIMEMARRFRVGHPTVREALKKLEAVGVVEIRHGSGVYVSRTRDVLMVASDYGGKVTKKLLLDLIQARTPIEMQSVALATKNATADDFGEMRRLLAVVATLTLGVPVRAQQRPLYLDESLTFEQRARDLVSRMTLEEKVMQMKDVAPAIPRLGVPEYNWWNEALHGVARAGLATVFPQAIAVASTWDDSAMLQMATVISDEARAKHHEYLRHDSHQRYQGLTFWSPNINLFRDPRWGRGQETYGEDPFLTGSLAVQFIHGLQVDHPKYFKTISTVKHFAVHSGPEPERHTFDAVVSERDLRESYLPHFEMGIRMGGAYSLMCAYNAIDGQPACANDKLLKDILRGEWKFPGYVVSDCGAIDDIYLRHKVAPSAAAAAALAVKTGTDLDCGNVYPHLAEAVQQGLI